MWTDLLADSLPIVNAVLRNSLGGWATTVNSQQQLTHSVNSSLHDGTWADVCWPGFTAGWSWQMVSVSFWLPYNSTHIHAAAVTSWVSVCPDVRCVSAGMTSAHSRGERGHFHSDELGQTAPVLLHIPPAAGWHTLKVWCLLVPRPPGRDREKNVERHEDGGGRNEMEMEENISPWAVVVVVQLCCVRPKTQPASNVSQLAATLNCNCDLWPTHTLQLISKQGD